MKKTYVVAGAIVIAVSLWMTTGVFKDKSAGHASESITSSEGAEGAPAKVVSRVRVRHLVAQPQRTEIVIRGRTEAKRVVDVRAETAGRVVAVGVEKGQRVQAGDLLCELAEDDRRVRLAQAQAAEQKASIDYEGALKLKEKGLLSDSQIAASKAAMESARAALKAAELEVEHARMRAPFAGFVEDRPAEVGSLMERSGVCARLLDEASLLATGQASEREVLPLALGMPVVVRLDSGENINGTISFIGRTADPKTRTYRVEAALAMGTASVRDGVTAQITVPLQEVIAHKITPAVLALDDAGKVGVRIVNAQRVVEFHHVDVVRESMDGIWVTGLPQEIDLITVGQELVADGDKVETSPDNSGTARAGDVSQADKP